MESKRVKNMEPSCKEKSGQGGSFYCANSIVIGLTGGIATGKSTVAKAFADLGACVISADDIVHKLLEHGTQTWQSVVKEFGGGILMPDGSIDRRRLASIVFADEAKRKRLERIVHPAVIAELTEDAKKFRESGRGVLVLEIPLLIETSSLALVDRVVVVTADEDVQVSRLVERYGITPGEAKQRINAQIPLSEKIKHADWIVSTNGTMDDTLAQVNKVWCDIQKALA